MSEQRNAESVPLCVNCGTVIRWSLDFRRWVHDQGNARYCVANFTSIGTPTTEAEPEQIDGSGAA